MQRELKFRIWDGEKFLRSFGDYEYCVEGDSFGKLYARSRWRGESDGLIDGAIIQQFTGLQDKNGKDIYEGDILLLKYRSTYEIWNDKEFIGWSKDEKDFYSLHRVEFFNDEFPVNCNEYTILINGWGIKQIYSSDETSSINKRLEDQINPIGGQAKAKNYGSFGANSKNYEIIGNIFENPELLK